jgi:hypothetical protein
MNILPWRAFGDAPVGFSSFLVIAGVFLIGKVPLVRF